MREYYQKLWITRLKSKIFLHLFLLILIFITFYLRIYHAPLGWFFHDSARDILMAQAIATGKLYPSVGPSAGGIFPLGPFYYYLLSLPLFFTTQIIAPYYFIALINAASVLLTYFFTKHFFGVKTAIIASFLYATFPFTIITGRNMWNVALLPTFNLLFFWPLFLWLNGKKWALAILFFTFSLLTQVHATAICFGLIILFSLFINRKALSWKYLIIGTILAISLYLPYFCHEWQNNFENLKAIFFFLKKNYTSSSTSTFATLLVNAILLYPKVGREFALSPFLVFALQFETIFLISALIFYGIKAVLRKITPYELLIFAWYVIPIILIFFKKDKIWFYYLDVLYPGIFILLSHFLSSFLKNKKIVLFLLVGVFTTAHFLSTVWIDYNLTQNGYYRIHLAGLQNIRLLNHDQKMIILPTFKTKWQFWQKLTSIYPLSFSQSLTHLHGPGAWLMRDQDNHFLAAYFTLKNPKLSHLPHLVVKLVEEENPSNALFHIGQFYVKKIDIPSCNHIPTHNPCPFPAWSYMGPALYDWHKTQVVFHCTSQPKPLIVEIIPSPLNKEIAIKFFCNGQPISGEEVHTPYAIIPKVFCLTCFKNLTILIKDCHPLVMDIDAYYQD